MLVCNFIIELKVIEVEVEGFVRDFDTLVVLDEGKRDFIKLGVYNLSRIFLYLLFWCCNFINDNESFVIIENYIDLG